MFNHNARPARKGFSSGARWDRPSLNNKTSVNAHQAIEVVARFAPGKIRPLYLKLNNHNYRIERVNYFWQDRQGREKLYCFNVTDGANVFQIYFSNQSLSWRLAKIE
ncbi:MAG: hypothetical protein JW869_03675 [Candidatus Omnitrophica bacterium]|nr:hypothetical protein [Candidatus Omnitrophota bacterium]